MNCFIYKSSKKDQLYIYLPCKDDFDVVPPALLDSLGQPEFVMQLWLDAGRKLARANAREVMLALTEQGFYLQMPPEDPLHDLRGGGLY
ncbi:MAG: YcgL domain-containing protein [Thiohalomonadaceae bacterium]